MLDRLPLADHVRDICVDVICGARRRCCRSRISAGMHFRRHSVSLPALAVSAQFWSAKAAEEASPPVFERADKAVL